MNVDLRFNVIIYGYIEAPWNQEWDQCWEIHMHNKKVLEALPSNTTDTIYFMREMFSIPSLKAKSEISVPVFDIQLINFSCVYSDMFYLESSWLQQFESILQQLFWDRVVLHLSFTDYRYKWETNPSVIKENLFHRPLRPTKEWVRTCYQLQEQEVTLNSITAAPTFDA